MGACVRFQIPIQRTSKKSKCSQTCLLLYILRCRDSSMIFLINSLLLSFNLFYCSKLSKCETFSVTVGWWEFCEKHIAPKIKEYFGLVGSIKNSIHKILWQWSINCQFQWIHFHKWISQGSKHRVVSSFTWKIIVPD